MTGPVSVIMAGNRDLTQLYALCACGWQSRRFSSQQLALRAAEEHGSTLTEGQRWIVAPEPAPAASARRLCELCGEPLRTRRGALHPACLREQTRRARIAGGQTFAGTPDVWRWRIRHP